MQHQKIQLKGGGSTRNIALLQNNVSLNEKFLLNYTTTKHK